MKTLAFAMALFVLCWSNSSGASAAENNGKVRTWTDASGAFTLEAEFDGLEDGKVQLKRPGGKVVAVPLDRLSEEDQKFVEKQTGGKEQEAGGGEGASGESRELAHDDGAPTGKRSIAGGGHAVRLEAPDDSWCVTAVKLFGSRYGYPQAPKEDFHVWICDEKLKPIADFKFPYSTFARGEPKWVTMKVKSTKVPQKFAVCVGFNPEQTKGVYVSHDAASTGNSLVGLPTSGFRPFSNGDWLIRARIQPSSDEAAKADKRSVVE